MCREEWSTLACREGKLRMLTEILSVLPRWTFIASLVFIAGCGDGRTLTDEQAQAKLGEYQTIYEAGVRLRLPKDFVRSTKDPAFGDYKTKCIVFAKRLSVPFNADFEQHSKSLRENRILGRKTVTIEGKQGILIHHERAAPDGDPTNIRRHWDLVFGDEGDSWIISGVYYKHLPPEHGEVLRAAVLSTRLDDSPIPKPGERRSFTCDPPPGLKVVESVWKELVFTEDGTVPTKDHAAPILRIVEYLANPEETIVEFAELSLRGAKQLKRVEIELMKHVNINGLRGVENRAHCEVGKSNSPLDLYQVVLVDGDSVIHLLGEVGTERGAEFIPVFQATAVSLKKK